MKVRKIIARNMSEGLRAVSAELGPDAMILSNRRVERGIEIMAAVRVDDAAGPATPTESVSGSRQDPTLRRDPPVTDPALYHTGQRSNAADNRRTQDPAPEHRRTATPTESMENGILRLSGSEAGGLSRENLLSLLEKHSDPLEEKRQKLRQQILDQQTDGSTPVTSGTGRKTEPSGTARKGASLSPEALRREMPESRAASGGSEELQAMRQELASLRSWLEDRQAPATATAPAGALQGTLEAMGFDVRCRQPLIDRFGAKGGNSGWDEASRQVARLLEKDAYCLIRKGGVAAMVGPTGAGKTTTLSKIATRFAMQHGAADLGIISLDQYRIGAHESVRILGRILGCDVRLAEPEDSLEGLLESLRNKKLILIDTNGSERGLEGFRSQLGESVLEQQIQPMLVLPANLSSHALGQAWRRFGPVRPRGIVLTKADESPEIGLVLSLALRKKLPLNYWSDGTQVPQDLHAGNLSALLEQSHRALRDVTDNRETQTQFG